MAIGHLDPNLTGFMLRKRIADFILLTTQFCEILQSYAGFYLKLLNFFNVNGPNLPVYSSRKIVKQLANGLYSEADEQAVASKLVKEFLSRGIRRKPKPDTFDGISNKIENRPHKFTVSPEKIALNFAT